MTGPPRPTRPWLAMVVFPAMVAVMMAILLGNVPAMVLPLVGLLWLGMAMVVALDVAGWWLGRRPDDGDDDDDVTETRIW